MLAEVIAFFGYVSLAIGMYMLGKDNIWGWWVYFLGSAIWFVNGFVIENLNMIVWNVIFCIINARGWFVWRKNARA